MPEALGDSLGDLAGGVPRLKGVRVKVPIDSSVNNGSVSVIASPSLMESRPKRHEANILLFWPILISEDSTLLGVALLTLDF